ncbi:MAG: N-acetylmuramoyl-L-alanine amidase [Flavobacteriales bacterium]|nr:N-acetylmuramoyl-L-alanine amidase [Flavobacteriales bacterium]
MDKTNLLNNSYAKKRIFLTFFISMALLFSTSLYSQTGLGIKTVVIDAGHGGKDPGAVAKTKLQEKDVVLDVSLQLGKLISASFPKVKVVYTRSTDVFIGLSKRAKIANDAGADLFISIHANAAGNISAKGFESFVLGLHKSEAALEVAKWENSSILMEEDHEQKYESFDPNDPDAYIALSLRQNAFLDQSLKLAHLFQKNCVGDLKRPDRGVKQAGFLVLYKTTMPSVLVELGFLSNVEEEKFLASKNGRSSLAKELFDAFAAYKDQNDKVDGTLKSDLEDQSKASNTKKNDKVGFSEGNQSVVFRVQVATSKIKLELKPFNFKGMKDVDRIQSGNKYKYIVGNYSSIEMAKIRQAEVRKIGYESAFVIAFENGKRLDLQKAIEKSKM